jgi:hypothetical protein
VRGLLVLALALAVTAAAAHDIPAGAPHCSLSEPPDAAARGFRTGGQPARLFPASPGPQYTGCQWIWVAWGTPGTWDYWATTYYESGVPKVQRVRYPPLPVQSTIQRCVYGADGRAQKFIDGSDWRRDCPSARDLQELLRVAPKENEAWGFF